LTEEQWAIVERCCGKRVGRITAVVRGTTSVRCSTGCSRCWARGSVARVAGEVSSVPDLPPAIPAVDPFRQAGAGAEAVGASAVQARQAQPGRSVRGCHLRERQKWGFAVGPIRRGKGTKIVAIAAGNSLPLALPVQSASPAECRLAEEVLAGSFLDQLPARLIGDKAYDSDGLYSHLAECYGIELIAPNRRGRKRITQDRRKLHRYRRRWEMERLFAWMHTFGRLATRWEYHVENFLGLVHIGCIHIMLRHL